MISGERRGRTDPDRSWSSIDISIYIYIYIVTSVIYAWTLFHLSCLLISPILETLATVYPYRRDALVGVLVVVVQLPRSISRND